MTFDVSGDAYDQFVGRYARKLAPVFADFAAVRAGLSALDVGCGSGLLTEELARRLGVENVAGIDPSPLLDACRERVPGADLRSGSAEELPWSEDSFDAALAQLVIHFMSDPAAGLREMARVVRPGGVVSACSWDFGEGMVALGTFWKAAAAVDRDAPTEERLFGHPEELLGLWQSQGLERVEVEALEVHASYADFDELWETFLLGVGPSGNYATSLDETRRNALREEYRRLLGDPVGSVTLPARAWAVRGRVPG
jgi:ubiquinone/menaquinone biosynthesis C-methylase UbiE